MREIFRHGRAVFFGFVLGSLFGRIILTVHPTENLTQLVVFCIGTLIGCVVGIWMSHALD